MSPVRPAPRQAPSPRLPPPRAEELTADGNIRYVWGMKATILIPATAAALLLCSCTGKAAPAGGEPSAAEKEATLGTVQEAAPQEAADQGSPAPSVQEAAQQEGPAAAGARPLLIREVDTHSRRMTPSKYIAEENELDLQHSVYDNSTLIPLGFSKEGCMAYIEQQSREGKGDTVTTFFIQDLVTDEIVWSLGDNGQDMDSEQGGLQKLIDDRGEEIDAAMQKYGIQDFPCTMEKLPYRDGTRELDARVLIKDTGRLMYEMLRIQDYECEVFSPDGRKKTVRSKKEALVEGAYVCGYIKNPLEDRIAIILAERVYGFEGCDLLYSIAGCKLF